MTGNMRREENERQRERTTDRRKEKHVTHEKIAKKWRIRRIEESEKLEQ